MWKFLITVSWAQSDDYTLLLLSNQQSKSKDSLFILNEQEKQQILTFKKVEQMLADYIFDLKIDYKWIMNMNECQLISFWLTNQLIDWWQLYLIAILPKLNILPASKVHLMCRLE